MNLLAYVHLQRIYRSTGAGRVARQMTEHLAQIPEIQLHVLGSRSAYDATLAKVGEPWTSYTYSLFERGTSLQQKIWYVTRYPRAESFWNEVEVVYCAAESYVPTRKARLAVTLHDAAFFEEDGWAHPRRWKQRLKWTLLYRRLAKEADLFHTVSRFSAERIAHYFPEIRDRLHVVHNAVAPHFFQEPPQDGKAYVIEKGLDDRPFVMLPRGLHYRKNADLVLKAWPQIHEACPEARLVVTSHNDPNYVQRAQALGDSVIITGFLSEEAFHAIYDAATVTWMPSRYEGFGMPVIESMACGTPVVASDATAIPEVAGDAALLVDVVDQEAHVEAVVALLRDECLRGKFIEKGKEWSQKFTWSRAAADLYKGFGKIV